MTASGEAPSAADGVPTARRAPGAGPPVDCPGGRAVLDRDVGVPQESGGLGQVGRNPGGRGIRGGRRARRGRPRRGQHLRLHRGGPPGVRGHRAGPRRRSPGRRPAGRDRLHGRAVRRRTRRGPARGGPGGPVRGGPDRRHQQAGGGGAPRTSGTPVLLGRKPRAGRGALVRPAQPAPARVGGALVLCQGGRGLRPQLWVLRHPLVPRQAAVAHHRVDPGRGGPVGRTGREPPRGGPRGPRPLVVRPRPLDRPDGAAHRRPVGRRGPSDRGTGGGRWPVASTGCVSSTCTRRRWTTRWSRPFCPLGFPTSTSRSSTCRGRCSSACGDGAKATVSSSGSAPSGEPIRRLPSARRSSSATPGRPKPTTITSSSGWSRPSWTGWASSPSVTRPARTPRTSRTRWPTSWCRTLARVHRTAGRHHRRRRDLLIGTTVEVLIDAPGEGRTYREAPEIDGIVSVPGDLPVGAFVDVVVTGADGPDLIAEPLPRPGHGSGMMSDGAVHPVHP